MFVRLWEGRYRLILAFWGFYVVGNLVAFLVAMIAAIPFSAAGARPLGLIAFGVVIYGYLLLSSVGVWRSAASYPLTRWWPNLAKGVVALWAVRTIWLWADGGALNFAARVMR